MPEVMIISVLIDCVRSGMTRKQADKVVEDWDKEYDRMIGASLRVKEFIKLPPLIQKGVREGLEPG